MDCRDCPRYDADVRVCQDGKINPQRWEHVVEAANVFGIRAICPLNDHRERLVQSRAKAVEPSRRTQPRDSVG